MGNPNEAELPLMAPPSYSEEDIESTSNIVSQNIFKLNVTYMVVTPEKDVVVTQSEFFFNGDMTVDEASDIAIRGYPDAIETTFEHKAVLFKPTWYMGPIMVGSLDRKLSEVYKPKGTMWVTNSSESFLRLMMAQVKKNKKILIGYFLFLTFVVISPTLVMLQRLLD